MKETNKRLSYHLVITDNETGEVIEEKDVYAIIGAATGEDGSTLHMCVSNCNTLELAATIVGAQRILDKIKTDNPLPAALAAAGAIKAAEADE